jgi:hypothetical protein
LDCAAIFFGLGLALQPPVAEPFESPDDAPAPEGDAPEAPIAAPLEAGEPGEARKEPPAPRGATPLEPDGRASEASAKPARGPLDVPDKKTAHMVRMHLMFGPLMRIRDVDPVIAAGVEYGRMHGFSGAFHTTFIPAERNRAAGVPGVTEASMGLGAVARGRLKRPLYGSIALTVGIRIHRAATDNGVLHRVDPDFRLPIQGAWTIRGVGLSFAVVQGYSVRSREYERRGNVLWRRSAYRVGLLFGLHWDVMTRGKAAADGARPPRKGRR